MRLPRLSLAELKDAIRRKWRALAFVLACLLVFAGPTYGTYALYAINLPWPAPDLVGFAFLALGLVLIAYLLAPGGGGSSSQKL